MRDCLSSLALSEEARTIAARTEESAGGGATTDAEPADDANEAYPLLATGSAFHCHCSVVRLGRRGVVVAAAMGTGDGA
jgi:hypothetical protein